MGDPVPDPAPRTNEVTSPLQNWSEGDAGAEGRVCPLVYDELRRLAASYLSQERSGHTLQPTALVHEAYLRLVDARENISWQQQRQTGGWRISFFGRLG